MIRVIGMKLIADLIAEVHSVDKLLIKKWFEHLDKTSFISYFCSMKFIFIENSGRVRRLADSSVLKEGFRVRVMLWVVTALTCHCLK